MNKYIIPFTLFTLIYLCACSTVSKIEKQVIVTGYDFTSYTNEGFLFTPENYVGNYESIGILSVEILPELRKTGRGKAGQFYTPNMLWQYIPVRTSEVLDSLYKKAINMGADAIINLVIKRTELTYKNVTAPGVEASGFAIKRIEEQ